MSDVDPSQSAEDEDADVLAPGTLIAIVDPLCGWCWGAAPALARLAASGRGRVEVVASGLFIGDRPLTADFADYAWTNDQKIAALTGQPFTEIYREKVLGAIDGKLDSGPATLAFTAVQVREPEKALAALHALQRARWADGRDVTDPATCAAVLSEIGVDAETVAAFLDEEQPIIDALNQRAGFAQEMLTHLRARGVPTLARVTERGLERIDGRVLFENLDGVVEAAFGPATTH